MSATGPKTLTLEDMIRDQWKQDEGMATAMLLKFGYIAPVFIFTARNGDYFMFQCRWNSHDEEAENVNDAFNIALATDAAAVTMITETWLAIADRGTRDRSVRPSERPDRHEAVSVQGRMIDSPIRHTGLLEIHRGPDGKPTGTSRMNITPSSLVGAAGRLEHLSRPTQEDRLRAIKALAARGFNIQDIMNAVKRSPDT